MLALFHRHAVTDRDVVMLTDDFNGAAVIETHRVLVGRLMPRFLNQRADQSAGGRRADLGFRGGGAGRGQPDAAAERCAGGLWDGADAARLAAGICDEDVAINEAIGVHGAELIERLWRAKGAGPEPLRILTHCNAGWLATVDWGTALAPIYKAHAAGLQVHVWVSETRPRNQGMNLTAWELQRAGVPCTVVADNSCGQLMQSGLVDCVIVGSDRTARNGDVCNKIGTYLKALAAHDNGIPFYVALPSTTIDWQTRDGIAEIPIEERGADEVALSYGRLGDQRVAVRTVAEGTAVGNPAFDVTPARLVTGLITERGVCEASEEGLAKLFPERAGASS